MCIRDRARTIQLEGDMLQPATREYSDSFVPIDIFELSDEDIWALLEQCETGSTAEEAEKILEDNQIAFLECFEEGGTYPLYLEIEEGDVYKRQSQYSVCQFIKGFFINLLGIKLLPAASQHNFGTFFQLQTDPPFIHHLQDKISIGRKAHKS